MATLQLLLIFFTFFYTLATPTLTYVDLQTPPLPIDLSQLSPDLPELSPDLQLPSPDLQLPSMDLPLPSPDLPQLPTDFPQSSPDLPQSSPDLQQSLPDLPQSSLDLLQSSISPIPSPASQPLLDSPQLLTSQPPCSHACILSALGFQQLSMAASSSLTDVTTPVTIFAPTDSSLHTCPSCSIPLILHEHTVPRLYPLQLLRNLAFATKIQTLATDRCLTVTATTNTGDESTAIFINGAEITHPDLFNNGLIVVHGIEGYLSHLSPVSCKLEHLTTLSISPPKSSSSLNFMPLMLKDALLRLRISGYTVLALSLRDKYKELLNLRSLTVFGLDDDSIFTGGPNYVADLKFHIVPNMRLMEADLEKLPVNTVLPTMEEGENLLVTTAGGGGPLAALRINYMEMKSYDIVFNSRIVVHALSMPFSRITPSAAPEVNLCRVDQPECSLNGAVGIGEMLIGNPATDSTAKAENQFESTAKAENQFESTAKAENRFESTVKPDGLYQPTFNDADQYGL